MVHLIASRHVCCTVGAAWASKIGIRFFMSLIPVQDLSEAEGGLQADPSSVTSPVGADVAGYTMLGFQVRTSE